MKKTNLLVILFTLFFTVSSVKSQNYTYELIVKDINTVTVNQPNDAVEFSIYLKNTTANPTCDFVYASAQYFLSFNGDIASVSSDLECTKLLSGLPPSLQPANVRIGLAGYPNVIALSANNFQGRENSPVIPVTPATENGVLIEKLRLRRISGTLNEQSLGLSWTSSPIPLLTRLIVYGPECTSKGVVEITNAESHRIGSNEVLSVELINFSSSVTRNNVTLNWTTTAETNNQGFDIERQDVRGETQDVWTKIGFVSGNGTTTDSKTYTFSDRLSTGNYKYRLKQIDINGAINYHALNNEVVVGIPSAYALSQNYPNPFNPTTKIDFELPTDGNVSILLYDISGREVIKLVNEARAAGYYTVQLNASNLSSGMYFYRITSGSFVSTKKMVVLK